MTKNECSSLGLQANSFNVVTVFYSISLSLMSEHGNRGFNALVPIPQKRIKHIKVLQALTWAAISHDLNNCAGLCAQLRVLLRISARLCLSTAMLLFATPCQAHLSNMERWWAGTVKKKKIRYDERLSICVRKWGRRSSKGLKTLQWGN